jgi:hypothetical protein
MSARAALPAGPVLALAGALAFALAGCAAAPAPEAPALSAIALQNPGFELDPHPLSHCAPQWECSAHVNVHSFAYTIDPAQPHAGTRSLRIERVGTEPWGVIAQVVRDPALRGAKVRFSAVVRTEGADGNGGGLFLQFHDGRGVSLHWEKSLAKGTSPWQRRSVEFVVPAETYLLEVGAILEGPGRVWIDEARLEILELAPVGKKPV